MRIVSADFARPGLDLLPLDIVEFRRCVLGFERLGEPQLSLCRSSCDHTVCGRFAAIKIGVGGRLASWIDEHHNAKHQKRDNPNWS